MGIILLSLIVMLGCRRIIGKNLKSTVVELMRGEENIKKEGHYCLPNRGLTHGNLTIALGELKCKWEEYTVIFLVFVFSSFLMLLPMNMKNTIEDPSFITYMGVAESDIRIDIQYSEKLAKQKDAAASYLDIDPEIEKYAIYRNGYVQFQSVDGQWEYIRVESGDESVFPLEYLQGSAPDDSSEMALSYLNASELGKEVGDFITVSYRGEELFFTICGIYQDITYGGKTAKAAIDFRDIRIQLGIRILMIQLVAILVGTIFANSLGEIIFGWMLSSMGASKITMLVNPVTAYVLCPAVQLIIVFITVIMGTKVVRNYRIRDQIME